MNLLLSLMLLTAPVLADICVTSGAPACPTSGVRILDETYPTQSFVISQSAQRDSTSGRELPRRAMVGLMRAYQFNPATTPNIIYPVTTDQFNELKPLLIADLVREGMTEATATQLVSSRLKHAETVPFTWQQDYFEATFDPATGQPRMNFTEVYRERDAEEKNFTEHSFGAITSAGVCGLSAGPELKTAIPTKLQILMSPVDDKGKPAVLSSLEPLLGGSVALGAEYGGNMEGLPGGLCLVGNNMIEKFATQVCGPTSNIVRAEVSWLTVGHVDEIFKVVPDKRLIPGRPRECSFSILSADTELGLSLLQAPSELNRPTLVRPRDPSLESGLAGISQNEDFQNSYVNPPAMAILCPIVNESAPAKPSAPSRSQEVIEASVRFFLPHALAADDPAMTDGDRSALRCARNFGEVTNQKFTEAIKKIPDLGVYNQRIQESLLRSREAIYQAILTRLPQCREFFPDAASMFTPVPNYFSPPVPQRASAHLLNGQLRAPGAAANSFFPNPTNSVLANSTLMYPGPLPDAYREHVDRVTKNLGLTPSHLDTWDYAHIGLGNIHCSSHSLPYCAPAGGSR